MNRKSTKILLWIIGIPIIGFVGYYVIQVIMVIAVFADFDSSSKAELISNFTENEQKIQDVAIFANEIIPDSIKVYIEFQNESSIDFWVWTEPTGHQFPRKYLFQLDLCQSSLTAGSLAVMAVAYGNSWTRKLIILTSRRRRKAVEVVVNGIIGRSNAVG